MKCLLQQDKYPAKFLLNSENDAAMIGNKNSNFN